MVTVYKTNNKASQSAIQYLQTNHIEHQVKSYRKNISYSLIMSLFEKSIDGIDPLLSKKSDCYNEVKEKIYDLKLSDLISFILKNPTVIKTPIMVDDRHLVVGYSKDSIRVFFPRN